MDAFRTLTATACRLPLANIDTDQLIPARFMSRSRSDGYGRYLLHDLRFDADGQPVAAFPLNGTGQSDARILIAGRNFGTGSSREAAVYALYDYGIRCVIAPSFGDIFASNAARNGLLPATVSEAEAALLLAGDGPVSIDLETLGITADGAGFRFTIDPVRRLQLLNGWDDIDLTQRYRDDIRAFRAAHRTAAPWAWPPGSADQNRL